MANFVGKWKEGGFKLTPQRMAIMDYLEGNKEHPTAGRIYEDLKPNYPSMSMATVYNTLRTMAELGLVQLLRLDKEQEARYDPNTGAHHHFFCRRCEAIIDLPQKGSLSSFKEFAKRSKHRVERASLTLTGVCASCLKNKSLNT